MANQNLNVDLVLEGGGVKGIGLVGAALELADAGYYFPRVAGTSAGAIVGSLIAAYQRAGMDLHGLVDVMHSVDYKRFDTGWPLPNWTGIVGDGWDAALFGGAHSSDYLVEWLGPELEKAGVRTFRDLAITDPRSSLAPYQRYSLVVHVTDLSRRALVRLPWDYARYDKDADTESVAEAVRASMSIPLYFRPVEVRTSRGKVTWVDGGVLSLFPVTVFDRTDGKKPRWPTWGIKLTGQPKVEPDEPIRTGVGIAVNTLATVVSDWNMYHLEDEGVNRRTIYVDTSGVSPNDFNIDAATQDRLFENGRIAARKFLETQVSTPPSLM